MKNKLPLESMPKLITTVTIMVLIGALFGTAGYFLGSKNIKKQMPEVYYNESQNEQISENSNNEGKPVDPADETADWKIYQDDPYSDLQPHKPWAYEFRYPNEFTLNIGDNSNYPMGSFLKAHQGGTGIQSVNVVVSITFPQNIYPETNFQSAWLAVAYDPDIANLSNCQELENNGIVKKMTEIQTINEITWYKGVSGSAALGTKIESRVYHTFHNDMCYEVVFHLSTANIGNFDPVLDIKAVDESEIWIKMENILSTFKFIDVDKTENLETYNGSETKIGSAFSFKYPSKIWDLEGLNLVRKNLDGCIFSPSVLWRNRLVNVISDEDIILNNYKARKVKTGIKDNASSIDYYFDSETSAVFSLSMPENKRDKTICEKDVEVILDTISF